MWENHSKLIIIEEGSVGGFSSHCLHFLSSKGILNHGDKEIRCLTMPDYFQDHASQKEQLANAGLDVEGLSNTIREMLPLSKLNNDVIVK